MIAESVARLVQVRRQAEEECGRYPDHMQLREMENQRLRRVLQQADRNAVKSQNAARLATEELSRAQAQNVGVPPRVAKPPSQIVGSPRLPQNASPRRQANLGQPTNPDGKAKGTIGWKT